MELLCELEPTSEPPGATTLLGPASVAAESSQRNWNDWVDLVRVIHCILRDVDGFLARNDVATRKGTLDLAAADRKNMAFWTKIAKWWIVFCLFLDVRCLHQQIKKRGRNKKLL